MKALAILAFKSLNARRATAILTVLSIALSVLLLLGVEKLRLAARAGFESTISGTDLIVGARTSSINLLLYSVFRLGDPTANISWETYEGFSGRPDVAWTVPISLGDSHKGFRVLGTTRAYFDHYRYAGGRSLAFAEGAPFDGVFDAVLGATVARDLDYALGDDLIISHGVQSAAFAEHKDRPFRVAGVLKPTGTPVDRTVHISLEGVEAVHIGWEGGGPSLRGRAPVEAIDPASLEPDQITAFLVGLKSKSAVLRYQRDANTFPNEALSAIIPGVALARLWSVTSAAELALRAIAALVVAAGLVGMMTAILTSLNERRREMALLRAAGARARDVFALLMAESLFIAATGAALGATLLFAAMRFGAAAIETRFGAPLAGLGPAPYDVIVIGAVVAAGLLLGAIPAALAYRNSLADGLSMRV